MRRFFSFAMMLFACSALRAQDATLPPTAQTAVLTVEGKGVQIYACKSGRWVFVAPAARLFDAAGLEVGTHGDGPVWHLQDGSSVYGQVIAKAPSPDADAIPWLLLKAARTSGAGKLTATDFIRRSETKGGVPPGASCDTQHAGDLVRVPYTATYTFYSANTPK